MVEYLSSKCEAPSSNPITPKKKCLVSTIFIITQQSCALVTFKMEKNKVLCFLVYSPVQTLKDRSKLLTRLTLAESFLLCALISVRVNHAKRHHLAPFCSLLICVTRLSLSMPVPLTCVLCCSLPSSAQGKEMCSKCLSMHEAQTLRL
jgi:hypothetical protein